MRLAISLISLFVPLAVKQICVFGYYAIIMQMCMCILLFVNGWNRESEAYGKTEEKQLARQTGREHVVTIPTKRIFHLNNLKTWFWSGDDEQKLSVN